MGTVTKQRQHIPEQHRRPHHGTGQSNTLLQPAPLPPESWRKDEGRSGKALILHSLGKTSTALSGQAPGPWVSAAMALDAPPLGVQGAGTRGVTEQRPITPSRAHSLDGLVVFPEAFHCRTCPYRHGCLWEGRTHLQPAPCC